MRATGYPHLFRFELELASAPRWKSNCILLLILARSFLALKKQNGSETYRNVLKVSCAEPLAIDQVITYGSEKSPLWLCVASIGLTNQLSLFTNHQSLLTSHGRASGPVAADLR